MLLLDYIFTYFLQNIPDIRAMFTSPKGTTSSPNKKTRVISPRFNIFNLLNYIHKPPQVLIVCPVT